MTFFIKILALKIIEKTLTLPWSFAPAAAPHYDDDI